MSATPTGAAPVVELVRLPTEPYPGLRPFLDHEAALLLGRERQMREVIERMQQTKFVAVIGGSGSGKSSLIHAGVIPELRSFGIPGAGDFWIPLVYTPGTNASAPDDGKPRNTPVTRLAWKFAKLLKSRDSAAQDAARLVEIARVFRQETGFARLVDAYADELLVPPGPKANDVRLLFVIDQFEELFHRTNKDNEDARLMVERVIDHFYSPHPRCYVVLTMRSEHLNDCASYLELPDAINKSSYLVRRLDAQELHDAIVGPAQRFLRLLHRQGVGDTTRLPDAVEFDPLVVERLQADVNAITHDPDHLPLLQHLLARLWATACEREGVTVGVPAHIVWSDLVCAVSADRAATDLPADKKINALRASLENWAEAVFRRHTAEGEQARIESMLRHLAFKDPNTGMYTQQRIDVDDRSVFGADVDTRNVLWGLTEHGFVGSVDYLFWDDENPERVTLKVSHESFIRGWLRFRSLIDEEAERFEEFVAVLRKCSSWSGNKPSELLLEASELRRMHDAELEPVFASAAQRKSWFTALLQDRDGARLAKYEPEIDAFLAASAAKQLAIARRASSARWVLFGVAALALMLLPWVLFSVFVQLPVKERAELFFDAGGVADQARLSNSFAGFDVAADQLRRLIDAAGWVVHGNESHADGMPTNGRQRIDMFMVWRSRMSALVFDNLSGLTFVEGQKRFLAKVANQAEPRVNGQLRLLLTSALWNGGATPAAAPLSGSVAKRAEQCEIDDGGPRKPSGRMFLRPDRVGNMPQRGIFIPKSMATRPDEIVLLVASVDPATTRCVAGERIYSVPRSLKPAILFDALLGYLIVSTEDAAKDQRGVALIEVDWLPTRDGKTWRIKRRPVTVLNGGDAVERARRHAGTEGVRSVDTWHTSGGRTFRVDDQNWRVIATAALPLDTNSNRSDWAPLERARKPSTCFTLNERLNPNSQSGSESSSAMFERGKNCFQIKRGQPALAGQATASTAQVSALPAPGREAQLEEVLVAVYNKPSASDFDKPGVSFATSVASLDQFGRFGRAQNRWFVGASPRYDGWIALLHPIGAIEKYFGAPWSTRALMRLAQDVEKDQPATAPVNAPPPAGSNHRADRCAGGESPCCAARSQACAARNEIFGLSAAFEQPQDLPPVRPRASSPPRR